MCVAFFWLCVVVCVCVVFCFDCVLFVYVCVLLFFWLCVVVCFCVFLCVFVCVCVTQTERLQCSGCHPVVDSLCSNNVCVRAYLRMSRQYVHTLLCTDTSI